MLKSQSCRKTRRRSKKAFPRLSLKTDIKSLRESLKPQKAEIKQTEKAIAKLEDKKAAAEAKAAEAAKKAEAEDVLKKLLASGMTADEILAKLK